MKRLNAAKNTINTAKNQGKKRGARPSGTAVTEGGFRTSFQRMKRGMKCVLRARNVSRASSRGRGRCERVVDSADSNSPRLERGRRGALSLCNDRQTTATSCEFLVSAALALWFRALLRRYLKIYRAGLLYFYQRTGPLIAACLHCVVCVGTGLIK